MAEMTWGTHSPPGSSAVRHAVASTDFVDSPVSDALILTETERNPILKFLSADEAVHAARAYNPDVSHTSRLEEALELAKQRAGTEGTILIMGTQSLMADGGIYEFEPIAGKSP